MKAALMTSIDGPVSVEEVETLPAGPRDVREGQVAGQEGDAGAVGLRRVRDERGRRQRLRVQRLVAQLVRMLGLLGWGRSARHQASPQHFCPPHGTQSGERRPRGGEQGKAQATGEYPAGQLPIVRDHDGLAIERGVPR